MTDTAPNLLNPLGLSPDALARRVCDAMLAGDATTRSLGMTVRAVGAGTSTVAMRIREDMVNGHGTCHGGMLATLADSAFAFACNAFNEVTVAAGFSIDCVAPARLDEVIVADCQLFWRSGRTGVYHVTLTREGDGRRIAHFTGRSFTIKGQPVVRDWDAA